MVFVARAAARLAKSTDGAKLIKVMPKLRRASQVPGFLTGPTTLYDKKNHNPRGNPKDWIYVRAGTTGPDGYVTPDK